MADAIEHLAARIADCQKRLDAAELARGPTTKLEGELDALKRDHAKLVADHAQAIQAAQQAEFDAIEQAATAETGEILERVRGVLPPITIPTPEVDDGPVLIAAREHARAQNELAKLNAVLAERQKMADSLARLVDEHQEILDRIGDRLIDGAEQPADDLQRRKSQQFLERKKPLHQAAVEDARAAEAAVRLAETVRQRAYATMTEADDSARRDGYTQRLEALDAALLEVLGLAATVDKRLLQQPSYVGSHELRGALQRLAIKYPILADSLNPASPRRLASNRLAAALAMAGAEEE